MSSEEQENVTIGPPTEPHLSSPSLADSTPSGTDSSLSFAWGPGALAGKFLRWLGESTLDVVVLVVIRTRLVIIKQAVRERPHIFQDAATPAESREVRRMYGNLQELCGEEYYPLAIRRKAARLVLEIAFLVYLKQFNTLGELSGSLSSVRPIREDPWDRWTTLLRLSNLSALSTVSTTFPQSRPTRSFSTDTGAASQVATTTTITQYTTTSGATPSGFFSEARTSVTSLGSMSRHTGVEVGVRRKLSRIKRTIRRKPHIFLGSQGVKHMQEVDYIYNELQDLSRFHASPSTRRRAARLILEIAVLISGPGDIILLDDASNNHNESRMWIELVTQTYVHSLLSVRPPAPSAT